jgi:hypothetical protein
MINYKIDKNKNINQISLIVQLIMIKCKPEFIFKLYLLIIFILNL